MTKENGHGSDGKGHANVPIAQVSTISLAKLHACDEQEEQRLLSACQREGVFHLDLGPANDNELWDWAAVDGLFAYAQEFFARPDTDKQRLPLDESISYNGYKRRGASVVDSRGNLDSMELLNISKIQSIAHHCELYVSAELMTPVQAEQARIFSSNAHSALLLILDILSRLLLISSPAENMAGMHRINVSSGDHLRVAEYREPDDQEPHEDQQLRLIPHTDFGSLTLLFSDNWGLQFQNPITKEFEYIEPSSRLALINCGDCIAKFSGGLLSSCIHRVVADHRNKVKWTVGYFLRPEDETPIRPLSSPLIPQAVPLGPGGQPAEVLTSKQWSLRREKAPTTANFQKSKAWHEQREQRQNWTIGNAPPR